MNREVAAAFLHEAVNATHLIPGNWIQLALAESGSDLLIGDVGLYLSDDGSFAELGFTLAREHQGKGHATRAAELAVQLALRHPTLAEVRAVTDELNKASVAVLMRAGFRHTGSHEAVFKEKPCVELHFTRTRNKTQTPRSS